MGKNTIEIYARLRPPQRGAAPYGIEDAKQLTFDVPRNAGDGYVNNSRERFAFKFDRVFDQDTTQADLFDAVARKSVKSALDGYNATIFAYGQTGSGKTFTITGGVEKYSERGIIPRVLSMIYSEFAKRADAQYSAYISYLEIYNEQGYDLLDPSHETKTIDDLPKVRMMEDADGNIHLRNLNTHLARTEEDAIGLLFIGDTNRVISVSPSNPVSTRSHCIFTVFIEARVPGSDVVRRSKLNLVDLAGSERVHKSNLDGKLLQEARYINVSLHYLEQVIVCLQDRKGYVPYRNSMMTSVLRDSLGGNCLTSMIATLSVDPDHIGETISTCRFAQRVACIANNATINEEVDPRMIIKRLQRQVADLKAELALVKGMDSGDDLGPLTDEALDALRGKVQAYVEDASIDAALQLTDMRSIQAAFHIFKEMVSRGQQAARVAESKPSVSQTEMLDEIQKLKQQLYLRNNEINILVGLVEKYKASLAGEHGSASRDSERDVVMVGRTGPSPSELPASLRSAAPAPLPTLAASSSSTAGAAAPSFASAAALSSSAQPRSSTVSFASDTVTSDAAASAAALRSRHANAPLAPRDVLEEPSAALDYFRRSYRKNEIIQDNKNVMRQKYEEARSLGEQVQATRQQMNDLKGRLDQLHVMRSMNATGPTDELDAREAQLKGDIDRLKLAYRDDFVRLRDLKAEIESLQRFLKQSRARMQADFEAWYTDQLERSQMDVPVDRLQAAAAAEGARQSVASASSMLSGASGAAPPPLPPSAASAAAPPGVVLTGDKQADAEIMAFYQLRDQRRAQLNQSMQR